MNSEHEIVIEKRQEPEARVASLVAALAREGVSFRVVDGATAYVVYILAV